MRKALPPSLEDPDDLVIRACAGDAEALQQCLLRMHDHLQRVIAGAVGARYQRYIDAEDVLQEAYIALFDGGTPHGDVSPAAFRRWVERVALNKLRDAQRALRRRRRDVARNRHAAEQAASTQNGLLQKLTAGGSTPSGTVARQESLAMLHIAIARLPEIQRQVLRLRIVEGKPLATVALTIGRSESAVWGLWTRALKNLRAFWGTMSGLGTSDAGPTT